MQLRDGVFLALGMIRAQKLTSFFGVLGVIIGVMFLITVVSVVEGLNSYMEEDFAKVLFGHNTLTVRRTPEISFESDPAVWREMARRPRLRFGDAEAIEQGLSVPARIAVSSSGGGRIVTEHGVQVDNVWLTASSAEFFRIRDYEVERGRLFTAPEDRMGMPVVILGYEAAETGFGALDPLGRTVRINGDPFRVIGVLKKQGTLFGMSMDNRAIGPAQSAIARSVNPHGVVDEILVRPVDDADLEQARIDIESIMRVRHRLRPIEANDFAIDTAEDSLSFWQTIKRILLIAFPGLVSIALVVGGIVIMNIMLVSVIERTREIRLRKALGARRRDIMWQMLVESATLSGLGAAIGIGLGIILAQIVRAASPLPATISPFWVTIATVMGVTVGMIAGLYPASRASVMDPVVALRQE
ncbi:MAG TPA: ABC transporter permease [Longimicrobiales bacterium]|nr:ABC transporter permease [Longimicrobiales bacterium]